MSDYTTVDLERDMNRLYFFGAAVVLGTIAVCGGLKLCDFVYERQNQKPIQREKESPLIPAIKTETKEAGR